MLRHSLLAAALAAPVHADVIIRVDSAANRHPISPQIYGGSFAPGGKQPGPGGTLSRWGGNATTRYNWQANASNRASDWYFESISEDGATPSAGVDSFIGLARYVGSEPMITIPANGWNGDRRQRTDDHHSNHWLGGEARTGAGRSEERCV